MRAREHCRRPRRRAALGADLQTRKSLAGSNSGANRCAPRHTEGAALEAAAVEAARERISKVAKSRRPLVKIICIRNYMESVMVSTLCDAQLAEQGVMALSGHKTPRAARLYVKRTDYQRVRAAAQRRDFVDANETATRAGRNRRSDKIV